MIKPKESYRYKVIHARIGGQKVQYTDSYRTARKLAREPFKYAWYGTWEDIFGTKIQSVFTTYPAHINTVTGAYACIERQ